MQCKWFVFFSLDWNRYLIKYPCLVVLFGCVAEMPTNTQTSTSTSTSTSAKVLAQTQTPTLESVGVCCVASDAGLFVV
jgi:hypothetical protein